MEKVRGFLRNLSEKRSYQIVFFVVSMCFVLLGYLVLRVAIERDLSHQYIVEEDKNLVKYIEDIRIDGDMLIISGWCFYKNVESDTDSVQVFLRNTEDEEDIVWLEVEEVVREDVNKYYNCEYNYSHTGFNAKTKVKRLELQESDYEIFIKLTYSKKVEGKLEDSINNDKEYVKTVSTKRYISEGELSAFVPIKELEKIKSFSGELNEISDEGQLLVYSNKADMYVYQYKGKLYWVAGERYYFEEDGTTKIQFQLDTTRTDYLPEDRASRGLTTDNLSFIFEKNEIVQDETDPYRIACYDVPCEYPITSMWTGYYTDSKWIWREYINVDIREFIE